MARSEQGELHRGQGELAPILAQLPGAIMAFGEDHRFRMAFGTALGIFNREPEDLVGKTLEEYLEELGFTDAAERSKRVFSALSGEPDSYEAWFGKTWYEVRTEPVRDTSGRVTGVLVLALDATDRKLAQLEVGKRDAMLQLAATEAPILLAMRDREGRLSFLCGKLLGDLNVDSWRALGTRFEMLPGTNDPEHPLVRAHAAAMAGRSSDPFHFDIADRTIEARVDPIADERGGVSGTVSVWLDVTQELRAEQMLRQRYEQLELAAAHTPSVLWSISREGIVTTITGRALGTLGWDPQRIVGKHIEEALRAAGAPDPAARAAEHLAALGGTPHSFETRWGDSDFVLHVRPVRAANGEITGAVGIAYDVTEQREAHERTAYLSNYDVLTGIPNRSLLRELLAQKIELCRRHGSSAAVAALDIDGFKRINDTLGLDAGDRLLTAVARRLAGVLSAGDAIARSSGDEFIIVRPDLFDPYAPADLGRTLLAVFDQPFEIARHELFVRASVGISIFPNDGSDADSLLAHADTALIQAKQNRRGTVQFYHRGLQAGISGRLALESDMRRALDRKEFELYYQPIVDIAQNRMVGAEALIRWNHPERGLVAPDAFISISEENGFIVPLGRWILQTACSQIQDWREYRGEDFFVSINVSPRQLDSDLFDALREALQGSGISPECLELEFTESAVIKDAQVGIAAIRELQELGVRISIDDFGTGYSSLAYLKRLPVDSLKIDRLFVRDLATNPYDAAIARAIIALAQSIDLRVIAEGVETVEQRDLLEALGCNLMQGYLFSRPVPAKQLFTAAAGVSAAGPRRE